MGFLQPDGAACDYGWCQHGRSRLAFRGPALVLGGAHVLAIGGNGTFGRGVVAPFPALLARRLGLPVANLGIANAGPDVFLGDEGVAELMAGAAVTVIEVLGAINLSNRYYTVHPRRNDRFLSASPALHALYPGVDFTEFNFTRHMLSTLADRDPGAFCEVAAQLRTTWETRMTALLDHCRARPVLLHLRGPSDGTATPCRPGIEPLLVNDAMIARISGRADRVVRVDVINHPSGDSDRPDGPDGPGQADHLGVAEALAPVLAELLHA